RVVGARRGPRGHRQGDAALHGHLLHPRIRLGPQQARRARADVSELILRDATPADVPLVLSLVRELAAFEREPDAVVATEADLLRDGFGPSPRFRVLLAQLGHPPVTTAGFAFYCFAYSTWRGRPVLYLEDLFVRPAHRKQGIGLALMKQL